MRPRDTRKALKDLRRLCKKHGIELTVSTKRGRGSHQALIFQDHETGEAISVVIAGHDEISPGVQRELLNTVGGLAARVTIGETVRDIFEEIFHG